MSNTERERMKGENWEHPPVFPVGWMFVWAWEKLTSYFAG